MLCLGFLGTRDHNNSKKVTVNDEGNDKLLVSKAMTGLVASRNIIQHDINSTCSAAFLFAGFVYKGTPYSCRKPSCQPWG